MSITAVIFDLDGTLLDRHRSLLRFLDDQYRRLIEPHLAEQQINLPLTEFRTRFVELDKRGYVPKEQVYPQIVGGFGLHKLGWQTLFDDFQTSFKQSCVGFPHLFQMLEILRGEGRKLGIITNGGTLVQNRAIDGLGIRDKFDAILVSETEGMRKPDAAIFMRALSRLKVERRESVYIGDNPIADVEGAKNAGLWAVWKRDDYWPTPENADATIDNLLELPALIRRFR